MFEYDALRAELRKKQAGEPCDEDGARKKLVRVITPTSIYWDMFSKEIIEMQPDERKRGRPPYFFDP